MDIKQLFKGCMALESFFTYDTGQTLKLYNKRPVREYFHAVTSVPRKKRPRGCGAKRRLSGTA